MGSESTDNRMVDASNEGDGHFVFNGCSFFYKKKAPLEVKLFTSKRCLIYSQEPQQEL